MYQLRAEDVSERQRQILDGLVDGKSNGILAEQLGITIDGVKWHVSQMLWDSGCTDRYQLADWWQRERGPQRRGAFFGFHRPSSGALAGPMRLAGTLALTAVLVVAIYAGWTCSSAAAPATVTPASALGKIAYVQNGDIYVKQLPDGAPQQITHITQADRDGNDGFSEPVWSPSGEWLIVRKRAQAGVIRADGTQLRLFDTATPAWSPPVWSPVDDRIAYVAVGEGGTPNQLVVENADGTGRTVVAHAQPGAGEDGYLHDPEWSNDGVRIAYVEEHRAPNAPAAGPTAADLRYEAVRVVSSSGGSEPEEMFVEPSPLTQGLGLIAWNTLGLLFYRTPSFTADTAGGVTLQFLHIETGHVVDLAPDNPTILLDPSLRSLPPGQPRIAITDGAGRETWTQKRIGLVVLGSGNLVDVTAPSVAAIQPALSRDRQEIAYSAMPDTPGAAGGDPAKPALSQRKIWSVDLSTQKCAYPPTLTNCTWRSTQLTTDPAYRDEYPQWSADSTQILWVRMDAQDNASLWLMDADGANQHEVVDGFDVPLIKPNADAALGYYGTISWQNSFAWWHPPSGPARSTTPAADATPPDTSALTHTLSLASLGLTLRYPADWVDDAQEPYYGCHGNCPTLGPASAEHPYGVEVFAEGLSFGCGPSCYVGNNAIGVGGDSCVGCAPGSTRTVRVAGLDAQQLEFQRNVPLGIANDTGDHTPNREIWTLIPHDGRAVFITAFYREGDTAAEQETRTAYNAILASVVVTAGN